MRIDKKQWIGALILLLLSVPIAASAYLQGSILKAVQAPAVIQETASEAESATTSDSPATTEEPTTEAPVILRAVSPTENLSADGGIDRKSVV